MKKVGSWSEKSYVQMFSGETIGEKSKVVYYVRFNRTSEAANEEEVALPSGATLQAQQVQQ